jgi:hypothetical protein
MARSYSGGFDSETRDKEQISIQKRKKNLGCFGSLSLSGFGDEALK